MASIEVDQDRLLRTFLELVGVDSFHGREDSVAELLTGYLEPLGVEFRRDPIGNLIGVWDAGADDRAPIMLNAHMDTIRPTEGMRPEVRDGAVYSDGSSVLGADDKAGLAAIVEAMRAVGEAGHAHGPVELVFTVGEEVGHVGSRAFDLTGVQSRRAFVLDSTAPVGGIVTRASGRRELRAAFTGAAAHAGAAPELGVSAIAMAAHAIARMPLGRIDADTVANIGTIAGGQADNIVAPEARITGEARSLSEHGLDRQIDAMTAAMDATAAEFGGSVDYQVESFVRAYALEGADPVVHLAEAAIRAAGLEPAHVATGGASDAHQFIANGLPSACLGAGYVNVHSDDEYMPLDALGSLAAVTIQLILNA